MANVGIITNQLRGLRNKDSELTAEALEEHEHQVTSIDLRVTALEDGGTVEADDAIVPSYE